MLAVEAIELRKSYVTCRRRGLLRCEKQAVEALRGVSFTARRGEVLGILGPNGAGKSTLVKILATLLLPDSGTARIVGYDIVSEREEVRKHIGVMLSVERGFFLRLTGRENLKYFGMLYGLSGSQLERRVEEVLRAVGLAKHADKLYEELSLGMKARLGIARALLTDPDILILDEPTLGLDPVSARRVRSLIRDLAVSGGKTVLLTTHNMHEAESICDRVAILDEGRILAIDTVEELKRKVSDTAFLEIRVAGDYSGKLAAVLRGLNLHVTARSDGSAGRLSIPVSVHSIEETLEAVLRTLRQAGLKVRGVSVREPSLEDVFVKLASREVSPHGRREG
jgi:ABC-2 type transport system ATP-binding protein